MDIVLLLSGMVLIALGTGVLLHSLTTGRTAPAAALRGLGGFALAYGAYQWLLAGHPGPGARDAIGPAELILLLLGSILLLEFGRSLLRLCAASTGRRAARLLARALGRHLYAPLVAALLALIWMAPGMDLACRYAFLFPGALFAGSALLWYPHTAPGRHSGAPARLYTAAGAAFLGFALAAGLVVPAASLFPANLVNEQSFLARTGVAAETVRSALVGLGGWTLLLILVHTQRRAWRSLRDSVLSLQRRALAQMQLLEDSGEPVLEIDERGSIRLANGAARRLLEPDNPQADPHPGAPTALLGRKPAELGLPLPNGTAPWSHAPNPGLHCARFPLDAQPGGAALLALRGSSTAAPDPLRFAAQIIEEAPEGFLLLDAEARVVAANRRFRENTGFGPGELLGQRPELFEVGGQAAGFLDRLLEAVETADRWEGEVWNRRGDGSVHLQWLTVSAVRDPAGALGQLVAVFSDVRDQREVQARLHYLAYYDGLTGLPNRELFSDHLKLALVHARRERHLVALMFLDLDRFKNINDTLGHQVGDRVLAGIAERLKGSVREGDTIARVGGDEFTVILPDLACAADAATVAQKILDAFVHPLQIDDQSFHLTASIGISVAPHDGEEIDTLLKNADTAMYRAKELGRNNYQFYTADMSARFHRWVALENDLRLALHSGTGLSMKYQPQIDIRTGRIVGAEALVRWQHPQLGDVPPASFIPVAEDSGLIGALGEWVLRTACRDAKAWVDQGSHDFRLAVNMSAHQLAQRDFLELVAEVLHETGLDPRYLELELTETVLMTNAEVTHDTLHALNKMGVELSIDDFGTGYSSLSYLRQFTIDKLKIDQSFVKDVAYDPNDATIATSIIAMAHKLKLKVIAEGVETQAQLDFLRRYGCDQIQGFLFSPPSGAQEVGRLLHERRGLH